MLLNDAQAQTVWSACNSTNSLRVPGLNFAAGRKQIETGRVLVFWSGMEVTPIGEPLLMPEAEAEWWKPDENDHWVKLMRSLIATPDKE
jgi:hypothetical protein